MVHQKILQNDILITFSPISQEQKFCQIWDLYRNIKNNKNVSCRKKSVNINDQIFQSIQKKSVFGPFYSIFPILEAVTILPKSGSVPMKFICRNFETASDTSGREHPGTKIGQTGRLYFIGPYQLLPSYCQRSNKIIEEIILNISNSTNQSPHLSHWPLWQIKTDSTLQTILCLCWTAWKYRIQWFSFQFWDISFPSEASNT